LFAPKSLTGRLQLTFAHIFSRPLRIGRGISLAMRTPSRTEVVSRREHDKLQNHLANINEQLRQEHEKIRKLSGLRSRLGLKGVYLVIADIITSSTEEFIINRGRNDGLTEGQFVISDNGIIGIISEVSDYRAKVKLITDPTCKIPVKIEKLNIERLMQGTGNNTSRILQVQVKHNVQKNQVIYACKKPGFLDVPMIVGRVAECKRDKENPTLWDITVEPATNLEQLRDVAVIVTNPPAELRK